jgi:hypothetical protein
MCRSPAAKLLLALSLPLSLLLSGHAQFRAGAAQTDITPELGGHGIYLAGFGHNRIATAVHDPLYVRCVAMQAGQRVVVLCAADLIGLFYSDVQKIRALFRTQGPEGALLIVACTHVHEGPDTLGLWGPTAEQSGVDAAYLDWVEQKIAATAAAATRSMKPARLRLARDNHPLLAQLQSVDRPPYVKDPLLLAMQAVSVPEGATIATVVNWSDHPETLNRKNTEITADYPGWLCRYLEQHYGGTALFFNGALGKVSTLGSQVALLDPDTGRVAEDGGWRKPELLGTAIGRLVEGALAHAETLSPNAMVARSSTFFFPLDNDRFRMAEAAGIFGDRRPLYTDGRPDASVAERSAGDQKVRAAAGRDLFTEVDYIELRAGDRLLAELVTVPGEAFPELVNGGIARYPGADFPEAPMETPVRQLLHTRYPFVLGLGNDELGYLIPKAEWDEHPPWLNNSPQAFYGEINSAGPDTAQAVTAALGELVAGKWKPDHREIGRSGHLKKATRSNPMTR